MANVTCGQQQGLKHGLLEQLLLGRTRYFYWLGRGLEQCQRRHDLGQHRGELDVRYVAHLICVALAGCLSECAGMRIKVDE